MDIKQGKALYMFARLCTYVTLQPVGTVQHSCRVMASKVKESQNSDYKTQVLQHVIIRVYCC